MDIIEKDGDNVECDGFSHKFGKCDLCTLI